MANAQLRWSDKFLYISLAVGIGIAFIIGIGFMIYIDYTKSKYLLELAQCALNHNQGHCFMAITNKHYNFTYYISMSVAMINAITGLILSILFMLNFKFRKSRA